MKKFNVTGSCNPQKHYMVDISNKFNQVMNLIEQGEYFAINRPRQYGKTTMLNMLAQSLWNKPDIDRDAGAGATFLSVALAGIHDVKSLKLKIRKDDETKLNSPWNIAADFNVDMSFNPAEIKTMLVSYSEDSGVKMDFNAVAERIHYYTSGYPFLVSKICKNIAEEEAGQKPDYNPKHWTLDDIDWSFRWLTRESYTTTNFDDLVKNLENNPDLYNLVQSILFNGTAKSISFSVKNPLVNLGIMYGMFKEENGRTVIHNRVYEQILSEYMRSKQETANPEQGFNGYTLGYRCHLWSQTEGSCRTENMAWRRISSGRPAPVVSVSRFPEPKTRLSPDFRF
jgi:hypothetical protein